MSIIRTILCDLDVLKAVHVGVKVAKKHIKLIEAFEADHHAKHEVDPEYDCHPASAAFYSMLERMDPSKYSNHPFAKISYSLSIQSWRESEAGQATAGVKISVIPLGMDAFEGVDMTDEEAVKAVFMRAVEGDADFERVVSETGEGEPLKMTRAEKRILRKGQKGQH